MMKKKSPLVFITATLFLYSSCVLTMNERDMESICMRKKIEYDSDKEGYQKEELSERKREEKKRKDFFYFIPEKDRYSENIYEQYKENNSMLKDDELKDFILEKKKEMCSNSVKEVEELINLHRCTTLTFCGCAGGIITGCIGSSLCAFFAVPRLLSESQGGGDGAVAARLLLFNIAGAAGGLAGGALGGTLGCIANIFRGCFLDDERKRKLAEEMIDLRDKIGSKEIDEK